MWSGSVVPRFPLVGTVYRSTSATSSVSVESALAQQQQRQQQQQAQQQQVCDGFK